MLKIHEQGIYLINGAPRAQADVSPDAARENTMAYRILRAHDIGGQKDALRIRFDALVSHDITYVGIIQTARCSGMKEFPLPYAMTNCHNSLCAVGGTINEDDHVFGLSAAKKYGGVYVPANQSVIHSYARETLAVCGGMILGSDSHTRYGALGTMAIGEGGPELVKQLLRNTYDINAPKVVLCYVTGKPKPGVGPHDVALTLVKATFASGFLKNKVIEFAGPGVAKLSADFRNGVDVMTTETTCLSSIWETDEEIEKFYAVHGRPEAYKRLCPGENAYYDGMIELKLDEIDCMIALPFHPSNAYTIRAFNQNAADILAGVEKEAGETFKNARLALRSKLGPDGVRADQGVIAGCAGGLYENIAETANILAGYGTGCGAFSLSVYPTSVPVSLALMRAGLSETLLDAGAILKPSFCGPCFGAGDVPANNGLSLRHTTRNFPNREGSKPGEGQLAAVALMDARSIAATARNGGVITAASDVEYETCYPDYVFDKGVYEKRVYNGFGKPQPETPLILGPNIADWPKMAPLADNMLLCLCAVIRDPVTTTDELIPSGETSSYRSNPLRLAEFTLSRRVPGYVEKAKAVRAMEQARLAGERPAALIDALARCGDADALRSCTQFGSCVFANKPGDGSAREQAASCQKVLGGFANICYAFATKRYRSNCVNWGILPFTLDEGAEFTGEDGDYVFVPHVREAIAQGREDIPAKLLTRDGEKDLLLHVKGLTANEKEIILQGCLMNYYAARAAMRAEQ